MTTPPVHGERAGALRLVRFDDGKANALTLDAVTALRAELAAAEADADVRVLVLEGRPGRFTVGLDTKTVLGGGPEGNALLGAMGELLVALYQSPVRVVAACTGHATAAGAMLLLVSDLRVGAEGPHRIGFSEVGIGMPLPELPILLARDRLDRRFHQRATMLGELFAPSDAKEAGFLDEVLGPDAVAPRARERAEALAALSPDAVVPTLERVRGATLERMREIVGAR